ncbi:Mucin-like protein [Acropora cervicornis]|uniref:Mucin-like protein n=1 Tax=Acropora cervicornis TaxID=6130 RepID=A0AAD9R0J9_ACRCE|nr:Mucin-like protein [Acropora cervicornis]
MHSIDLRLKALRTLDKADIMPTFTLVLLASICGVVLAESDNPCVRGIDLGFIVDRSRSVRTHNYITMKRALATFIDKFNVTPETTHVSMIFYAKEATLLFNLTDVQFQSNKAIKKKINSLSDRLYGGTRTDLALMKAHDHMFQRVHDRPKRPNVLLVFTDGNTAAESAPYSETVPPLEDKGVNIIAIGIGSNIDKKELEKIAGERGTVVRVPNFELLSDELNGMLKKVCTINGGYTLWSTWSGCSASCGKGFHTRFRNCTNPEPEGGGKNCDGIGPAKETEQCDLPKCEKSINGKYTRWTTWTKCSKTCGGGVRERYRSCTNPAPFGKGKNCNRFGKPRAVEKCNTKKCPKAPAPCSEGIDLGIIIDHSKSIGKTNIRRFYGQFLPAFLKRMKLSKKKTRIGIMKYSKDPSFLTKFKGKLSWSYKATAALLKKYEPKLSLHTRTDKAFKAAHKELFTKKGGDRRGRQNVLVTFTDGRVYPRRFVHAMLKEIPILRSKKACHIVAVGYGASRKINMTQLQEIAGDNAIKVNNPRRIKKLIRPIQKSVCAVDGGYDEWSMWSLCSATCGTGVKVRSRVCNSPPPRKGGKGCKRLGPATETVQCFEGKCPKYASLSVGIPNYVVVKTFLAQFVHYFPPTTRFSLITFAKYPEVRCKFSDVQCQTAEATHYLIADIPDKLKWGTRTDRALIAANDMVFTPEGGDRPDAGNLVMVEGKNAKMLAFGVGPSIREEDLNEIAGEKKWFYVEHFSQMKERIPDILNAACKDKMPGPLD